MVLIYRPRRDGRLSRPWCEVAQAEIRTHNLLIANPALYHTATSAPITTAAATFVFCLASLFFSYITPGQAGPLWIIQRSFQDCWCENRNSLDVLPVTHLTVSKLRRNPSMAKLNLEKIFAVVASCRLPFEAVSWWKGHHHQWSSDVEQVCDILSLCLHPSLSSAARLSTTKPPSFAKSRSIWILLLSCWFTFYSAFSNFMQQSLTQFHQIS